METEFISNFPPGFRFYPSDEELIEHYLLNKLNSHPLPANIIAEIELYNYNPWDLPKKALFGEEEWYFFSPRDRKYPHGARPNRMAGMGFWKATGTDKPILNSCGSRRIGVKKSLVFYSGRPPKGSKTEWIMNEYRLPDLTRPPKSKGSMRLDDWVLCRIRRKGNMSNKRWDEAQGSPTKCVPIKIEDHQVLPSPYTNNNYANYASNIKDDLFEDCHDLLASILGGQNLPPIDQPIFSPPFPIRSNKIEDFSQGNILDMKGISTFNQSQSQSQGEIFDFDTSNIVIKLQEFDTMAFYMEDFYSR